MARSHKIGYDKRPRFGWVDDLDKDPQFIYEVQNTGKERHPVVVIPLPFISASMRRKVRTLIKGTIWP